MRPDRYAALPLSIACAGALVGAFAFATDVAAQNVPATRARELRDEFGARLAQTKTPA